ncbi:putative metal-binding protein [Natronobacillus azotifigens]|uniref:Zinc-binding protein n=1 Tax=Natronobacillus azotifigens TaxID=472978 RepID=A0A9J6RFN5_9BACI|nr:putative zinc-binding protein [Natronobacillus azotifigens]MCZ0704416.1 putative zinc-binding protein [Natronobacillus azotifigens]
MKNADFPIVYSCSGCSSAAQTANAIAIKMDRANIAEMSCIAGVGGDVKSLVRTAKSGREIIAIDGCKLACSMHCLTRHEVEAKHHFVLSNFDVPKKKGIDPDPDLTLQTYLQIVDQIKHKNKKFNRVDWGVER